jgi:hypothetical protein
VILSANPFDVDPSLIGSIQVLRTYVAGVAVHGDSGTHTFDDTAE